MIHGYCLDLPVNSQNQKRNSHTEIRDEGVNTV